MNSEIPSVTTAGSTIWISNILIRTICADSVWIIVCHVMICPTRPEVPIPEEMAGPLLRIWNTQVAIGPVIAEVIIGGSQREDDYDKLLARIQDMGLKEEDYKFYLDLRKYGSARHAGFGLGFERCVMYLTGMANIRDVIPFPRTVNNCEL